MTDVAELAGEGVERLRVRLEKVPTWVIDFEEFTHFALTGRVLARMSIGYAPCLLLVDGEDTKMFRYGGSVDQCAAYAVTCSDWAGEEALAAQKMGD